MAKKADLQHRIIDATMKLTAAKGWRAITMADIAAEAAVSMAEIYRVFPSKGAILAGFHSRIDEAVLSEQSDTDSEESHRDRLFDVLMRRFDALVPYRDGIASLMRDFRSNPLAAACQARSFNRSMAWMLEAAGIATSGIRGAVRVRALGIIYLAVLRVWLTDDSADLSRTMAALNARLRQAEQFSHGLQSPRRRDDHMRPEEPTATA